MNLPLQPMPADISKTGVDVPEEFVRIRRYFAPLTQISGAFDLLDDAAALKIPQGQELIVTNDSVVAGVHYRGDESGARVAQKLARRNLSDLAAMGAEPYAYNLSFAIPQGTTEEWIASFVQGLMQNQKEFGWSLVGGDSLAVPQTAVIGMTAFGLVPAGKAVLRSGAKVDDDIYCSGTIGDGYLGLRVSRGEFPQLAPSNRKFLIDRYELPQPRLKLGQNLRNMATAAVDISDGLIADLSHLCRASKVGALIESHFVPLSLPANEIASQDGSLLKEILVGGDDYELIFTAPPLLRNRIANLGKEIALPITRIGKITTGGNVCVLDQKGQDLSLSYKGYSHFSAPKFES